MISQYQFTDSARRRRSTTTFTSKMWKSTIIIRKQTGKITPECRVNHKQITVAWGIAHRDRKQTACWCGICARSPPASGIGCRCLRSRCRRTWDSDRSNGRSTTAADSPHSRRAPQQVRTRLHRYIKSHCHRLEWHSVERIPPPGKLIPQNCYYWTPSKHAQCCGIWLGPITPM